MNSSEQRSDRIRWEKKRWLLFAAPLFILVLSSTLLPLGINAYHSFFDGPISNPYAHFVGFRHYHALLSDPAFWQSVGRGVLYAVLCASLQIALALAVALAFNQMKGLSVLFRSICLIPALVPPVATVAAFRVLFDSSYGLGQRPIQWLTGHGINLFSESMIFPSAIVLTSLQFFPLSFLLLSERIRLIPSSLYQRAGLDGLGPASTFFTITWPEISSVLFWLFALRFSISFGKFDVLYFLGGTSALAHSVETPPLYIFRVGLRQGQLGYGAAGSVALMLLVLAGIIAGYLLFLRFSKAPYQRRTLLLPRSHSSWPEFMSKRVTALLRYTTIVSTALLVLCPLIAALVLSLSANPMSPATGLSLKHFISLFQDYGFADGMRVSLWITVSTLLLALPATFLFSFIAEVFDFPTKGIARPVAVTMYCLPSVILAYGSQALASSSGILGSATALVGGLLSLVLPLALILMTSFGSDAPIVPPIESSAERIGILRYLRKVFAFNRFGAVFASGAFIFAACWSDYLFAVTLGGSKLRTAVVVFQEIYQGAVIPWGILVAGALVLVLPSVLITFAVEAVLRRRRYDYGL